MVLKACNQTLQRNETGGSAVFRVGTALLPDANWVARIVSTNTQVQLLTGDQATAQINTVVGAHPLSVQTTTDFDRDLMILSS